MTASSNRLPAPAALLPLLIAGLALFALSQYGDAFRLPLVTDDYFFLDKTRDAPFRVVWEPKNLVPAYYRPWSRELHYWVLQRLAGDSGTAFRAVNLALWLGVMAAYFALARRLAGPRVGAVATIAVAALGGWGVLLVWPAGAQELWMLLFALLFLNAFVRGRSMLATAALVPALLSKETAAVLPLIAVAWSWLGERATWRDALRRTAPALAVVAAWALMHPLLGGRWWMTLEGVVPFPAQAPPLHAATSAVLSVANLNVAPSPEGDWSIPMLRGIAGAVILAALTLIALRMSGAQPREKPRAATTGAQSRVTAPAEHKGMWRRIPFGAAWALIAWMPLLIPGLGWQTYYGMFGAMGAWLVIAGFLADRTPLAASLIAMLALVRSLQAAAFSPDWGSEWFQRRAARLTDVLKRELMARYPEFAPGSRVYLADLPGGVALVADPGNSPALRTWYRDPDLWVGFFSHYRLRAAEDTAGSDHFLVARKDRRGWHELIVGPEDVESARGDNSLWADYHEHLAGVLFQAGDVRNAYAENLKLAEALPDRPDFALNAAVCARDLGDSVASARWMANAAARQEAAKAAPSGAPPVP